MKKHMKNFICILLSFLLTACYTTQYVPLETQYNEFWKGKHKTEIIQAYGVADRTESDGGKGYIMIYEEFTINTSSSAYGDVRTSAYTNSVNTNITGKEYSSSSESRDYKEFFMDENDECYLVRTNYVKTEQVYSKKKTNWLIYGCVGYAAILALACSIPFMFE